MSCTACGSSLQTLEYQTRSADEAHTTVITYPLCPVDPSRIDPSRPPRMSYRGIERPIRRSLPCPVYRRSSLQKPVYTISFDIPREHPIFTVDLCHDHLIRTMPIRRRSMDGFTYDHTIAALITAKGMFEGMCTKLSSCEQIGIGVTVETHDVFGFRIPAGGALSMQGRYALWDQYKGQNCYIYQEFGEKKRKLVVEMGGNRPLVDVCKSITDHMYVNGMLPSNVVPYISKDTLSRLSNLSPRAWDASSPPESGYTFTSKPDGERVWLVWYANVWYICKPRGRGGFTKWLWSNISSGTTEPIIVDAEYTSSRGFIVIDYLTGTDGSPAPALRDLGWVAGQHSVIAARCHGLPLYMREYFSDFEAACRYSSRVLYPTDGIVAVRNGSTEILKVKSVKSMELAVSATGELVTADATPVISNPSPIS